MHERMMTAAVGALALVLGAGACREAPVEGRDTAAANEAAREVDRTAELQRERDFEFSKMDDRIAALERKYEEKRAATPRGTSGSPTPGLRHEARRDVEDVKTAVANLRTTTPDNWWDRHESALKTAFDEVESDVKRFAGTKRCRCRRRADASPMPPASRSAPRPSHRAATSSSSTCGPGLTRWTRRSTTSRPPDRERPS